MKKGLLTITALSLAVLLTACVTTIPNGLVEKNDLPPPQTTEAIVPETTEVIVPETTEYIPEETQAQEPTVAQTEPKPTEPKPTEPKPTEVSKKLLKPAEVKTIAFQHAKVKAANAREVEVELDKEKNSVHYDVSFEVGNTDYEYVIEAYTGEVLRHKKEAEKQPEKPKPTEPKPTEPKPTEPAVPTSQNISEEEAKTVAFNHAGVKSSQVGHAKVEWDRDDGKTYYDISFIAGSTEYEYKIEAKSGKLLHYEKEVKPAAEKTAAEAKAIAFNHAGVKEAKARDVEVEVDTVKGKTVYEIAFHANGYEYEYVIDGLSGRILQKEKELAD